MCCCRNKKITENLAMSHRSSNNINGKTMSNKQQHQQQQQYLQQCRNCHLKSRVGHTITDTTAAASSCSSSVKIPMWICLLVLLCYITTGATVFCVYQEQWSFVDSFFFAFSVLWTIGLQVENIEHKPPQTDGLFVVLCTLYLLIGLAILAMCVQLAYDTSTHCLSFHGRLSSCLHLNNEPRYIPYPQHY